MLGSIIGDIVGSIYEFRNTKNKEFQLFSPKGSYTDDSILTMATADWLLNGGNVADYYLKYATDYPTPMGAYGNSFYMWVRNSQKLGAPAKGNNSCGNGSAMRVGPVGWAFNTKEETLNAAKQSAECTHNHPEGIKGAQATALCIFMARQGATKDEIRAAIQQEFGYDLNFTCDDIRSTYGWEDTCQKSVPQAIVAFLDGTDFEDSIRNAISIGGDSDTIGCITGAIAEAFFGIPQSIRDKALPYLPTDFIATITAFEARYGKN
jgi:ADP-ribosylglycohydrolase